MIIFTSKILCQFIWKRSWNLFFSLLYMIFDMIKFLGNFVVHERVKLDLRQCVNCKQTKNLLTHIINTLFHTIYTIVCVDTCILKNETMMFTFGTWKVDIKQDTFGASYSDSLFPPSVWRIHYVTLFPKHGLHKCKCWWGSLNKFGSISSKQSTQKQKQSCYICLVWYT